MCLQFDPKSSTCIKQFGFFTCSRIVEGLSYSYVGLAPSGKLNGPSYVQFLDQSARMQRPIVSFQLTDWTSIYDYFGENSIIFGGENEESYTGSLV